MKADEVWYPKAAELRLPDVPDELRPQVRTFLETVLPLMTTGVIANHCWRTAQNLALAAKGPIAYVEGVATSEKEFHASPHGWNTYGGHRIDLIEEFAWLTGEREKWLYESVKEYDFAGVKYFADKYGLDSFDLTSNRISGDRKSVELMIFGKAAERLLGRISHGKPNLVLDLLRHDLDELGLFNDNSRQFQN